MLIALLLGLIFGFVGGCGLLYFIAESVIDVVPNRFHFGSFGLAFAVAFLPISVLLLLQFGKHVRWVKGGEYEDR